MNKSIIAIKTEEDNLQTEFEIVMENHIPQSSNEQRIHIINTIKNIDQELNDKQNLVNELNIDIEKLTNDADGFDYTIAVASGVLTGLIDAFYVGEFNWGDFKIDAYKYINEYVEKYASKKGYKSKGLKGAISFLEKHFSVDQDNVWKGKGFSSSRLHHLDDIAHHPTPLGLLASIAVSFLKVSVFVDKNGEWHWIQLQKDESQIVKIWIPIVITGILRWVVYLAESKYVERTGKELPKPIQKLLVALSYSPAVIQILKIMANWKGHLVSDVGGSKNKVGEGMGIPGFFISFLKEISSLPYLKNTQLPKYVSDLYSKEKWDLRAELAVFQYVGKQSIPIILNELLVRTFYFVRHLILEYKQSDGWNKMNWSNVIPWRNRTIVRMLTIASGSFIAVDITDAAIRSIPKSAGDPSLFFSHMFLRVNFVGIGRFAIAIGTDVYMGYKFSCLRNDRIKINSQILHLNNAKIFYKQADMWMTIEETEEVIIKMEETALSAIDYHFESIKEMGKKMEEIVSRKSEIEKKNPNLLSDISTKMSL